jgi:glycosyltransferase involved in cell wall biosynthesis
MHVVQINRQLHFGGGEVFTQFLTKALVDLGHKTTLICHPKARFWSTLTKYPNVSLEACERPSDASAALRRFAHLHQASLVLAHGPVPEDHFRAVPTDIFKVSICHMPVQGRNPRAFDHFDLVIPVSHWVLDGLLQAGLPAWAEPLWGIASVAPIDEDERIVASSRFDWDERKVRDRLFRLLEPAMEPFVHRAVFHKKSGLTLGIVSRLTPIKQFPLLFEYLAPVLSEFPQVNLEIFGAGGFDSVYDLRRALRPIRQQVRWWGHQPQSEIASVYRKLDFLLTGLPEKEALGLNVIEALSCGTNVLAPKAPPFTETVQPGHGGRLYQDPREDMGKDFRKMIAELLSSPNKGRSMPQQDHLEKFSFESFKSRVQRLMSQLENGKA